MEHIAISGMGKQSFSMFQQLELRRIIDFAKNSECLEEEVVQNQFRALWTAYCLHHDLNVDTGRYDSDLLSLWNVIEGDGAKEGAWTNFDEFDLFMGGLLC